MRILPTTLAAVTATGSFIVQNPPRYGGSRGAAALFRDTAK